MVIVNLYCILLDCVAFYCAHSFVVITLQTVDFV